MNKKIIISIGLLLNLVAISKTDCAVRRVFTGAKTALARHPWKVAAAVGCTGFAVAAGSFDMTPSLAIGSLALVETHHSLESFLQDVKMKDLYARLEQTRLELAEVKEDNSKDSFVTREEFDRDTVSRGEFEEALTLVSTLDESDLEDFARKTDLDGLATDSDLKDLRTHLRRSVGTRMGMFKSKVLKMLDGTL